MLMEKRPTVTLTSLRAAGRDDDTCCFLHLTGLVWEMTALYELDEYTQALHVWRAEGFPSGVNR